MKSVTGLILAGGRGTRMDILCTIRPKPTLPYAGIYRVIDFTLSNCVKSGITNIAALVDHQRTEMTRYLRRWHSSNRGIRSLSILHPRNGSYVGTADAVYRNLDFLNRQDSDTVMILAGDHIYKMDYSEMLDFHRRSGADATVGVVRVPIGEAYRFGTVLTEADGRITEFVEKSPRPRSDMASMGIYVFNKDLLSAFVEEDAANPLSRHDFGYAILPRILERGRLFAFEFDDYWQDIGTVDAYYESHMDLLGESPKFRTNSGWPVLRKRNSYPKQASRERENIVNSIVGPGCVVDGYVENSVLSPGVRIARGAMVRNSIVMANSRVGHHTIVERCILDERVKVGEFCFVGFGAGAMAATETNITVLGAGVTVPNHTAIGQSCLISPYAGPEEFTSNAIPSGTVISSPA